MSLNLRTRYIHLNKHALDQSKKTSKHSRIQKKIIFLDHSFSVEIDRASDVLLKVNL